MPRPKRKPAPVVAPPTRDVVGKRPKPGKRLTAQDKLDMMAAFARLLFTGQHTDAEAWRMVYEAGTQRKKASTAVAKASANARKRHPRVQAELKRLQELHAAQQAKEEEERQKAAAIAEAAAIATRDEVLKFHTKVMRCPSNALTAEHADLVLVVETKRLAPPKYDKKGNEIPHPDADADGYVTDVTRRPPDIKERQKSAESLAAMQGWNKGDPNLKQAADAFTEMLINIRGGGKS